MVIFYGHYEVIPGFFYFGIIVKNKYEKISTTRIYNKDLK